MTVTDVFPRNWLQAMVGGSNQAPPSTISTSSHQDYHCPICQLAYDAISVTLPAFNAQGPGGQLGQFEALLLECLQLNLISTFGL